MSVPQNIVSSVTTASHGVANVGIREDLEENIYRVAPEETPFTSGLGTVSCKQTYHEYQTESLAAADETNAQLEGDDVGTLGAPNTPTRLGNTCQIFWKTGGVSGTQEAVNLAGRDSELARQKVLKTIEIKRDFEKRALGNYAAVAESGSTARKFAGIQAFITSNDSRGASGSDGGFSASPGPSAATDGTQRTWTETILKSVMSTAFTNAGAGNCPNTVYMGGTHKQQASAFTGIADIRKDAGSGQATVVAAADMYVSDFGTLTFVPHPYALTRAAVFVRRDMVKIGVLRGLQSKALAVTGDNERFLILQEKTLVVCNEKAHGVAADLT